MFQPFVSVVVCTYNRCDYLDRCLRSLLEQSYPDFEVIVVDGPSTDGTSDVLKKYPEVLVLKQDRLNGLSYARNLGISAASGDIVAFIDDDAVADEHWLKYLVEPYSDERVGGTGGYAVNPSGYVQFDNGVINKIGIPQAVRKGEEPLKADEFQICMGTNSSFRRDVLYRVDGFDPYFRYYHDESELCVRIIMAGYEIVYQRKAIVTHEMAEGHNRKSPYDLNWSEILKNVVYYIMKNFRSDLRAFTIWPVQAFAWWLKFFFITYLNKSITFGQLINIYKKATVGVIKGYKDGLFRKNSQEKNLTYGAAARRTLKTKICHDRPLKICFLSQEYSKDCKGGICRYTYDIAHGLADMGNEVHIITKSDSSGDFMDNNVFVHKVVPEPIEGLKLSENMCVSEKNLCYSYAASIKLNDLIRDYSIQIVEAPLWDAEGFVFSLVKEIPLAIRLETPLFKVIDIQGWPVTEDLRLANWMEGETARRADLIIAISHNIGELIRSHHHLGDRNIHVCPLGIDIPDVVPSQEIKAGDRLNVLFVGRLEKRKGVETLFRAMPAVIDKIPSVQFNIVGSDTPTSPEGGSYREYLIKHLNPKYHNNVRFIGYVNNDELNEYYRDCDVFVAPSLYESFGLIYLEAMARGKPVIGCRVGGVPEVVKEGYTGLLVAPGNEKELTDAILTLLLKTELRTSMGKNGRDLVVNELAIKNMVENTYKVYSEQLFDSSGAYHSANLHKQNLKIT